MTDDAPWEDDDREDQTIPCAYKRESIDEQIELPPDMVHDLGKAMMEFEKLNPPNEARLARLRELMFGVKPDGQK